MNSLGLAILGLASLSAAMAIAVDDDRNPPPPKAPVITPDMSTCEAGKLTWLVGRPREQIPVPVDPSRRAVYCDACPGATDFHADRTDILFDANTGIITRVKCG